MRRLAFIFAVGLLAGALGLPAFAGSDEPSTIPSPAPAPACENGVPGGVNCVASKKEMKEAREAFARGLKLQERKHLDEAFDQFNTASRLVPQNPQFLTARELVKAQLVFNHVERGNVLLWEDLRAQAAAEFRAAIDLDPENRFAQERLEEARREPAVELPSTVPVRFLDAGEIHLVPKSEKASFHFSGDVNGLFALVSQAYGVTAQVDNTVPSRQVRFNLDEVDFFTALRLACQVSKTMWVAVDAHQMLVLPDNPENHKQFDRMSLRTFILPAHTTPQDVTDLGTTLRTMFEIRFINSGQTADTFEVRASPAVLEASAELLKQLSKERPQVMLDIRVYQINHQLMRNIGVHTPDTFNLYNIPAVALAGLGGQSISQLINQLIASGGINQAGSTGIAGLLAQLGGQSSGIFSQPLATFGGGLTFSGVSLDHFAANLSLNESWVRSLENMSLRASQGNDATFHLGERYPIQNASYAPIFNSPAISKVLGNQSYIPPFPSVSYEDLGLNLKAKPTIHGDNSVALQLELAVRSLTGTTNNGVPVISNREYKGSINLQDGEPAVVAGEISRSDMMSMSGIPGLGFMPGLNQAMVNNTKQEDDDELMIVITPHVILNSNRPTPEIWLSEK